MTSAERVLLNTGSLYLKMIVTTIVSLYLTRVVLETLGVDDYGLFNLIGGVVALLSFVSSALMVSTQRYLSVAMGRNDCSEIRKFYVTSFFIHILFSVLILILLEICSIFLFDGFFNIEPNKIGIAKTVYQLMIISTLATVIGVPYNAEINANEDLWFFALIETICTVLKLFVILLFDHVAYNDLILYTAWIMVISILNTLIKYVWCKIKYDECRKIIILQEWNVDTFKEMIGFTFWNAFGTLALVGRNQGVAIVLNICWGTAINAVYAIANQINGQLIYFSTMMTTSMTPQIMKSYGERDYKRMWRLSVFTSKLAYYLSAIFAIPLALEINFVLNIWLKNVPADTGIYCLLMLLMFLIMQLNPGVIRAIQATGNIKLYQMLSAVMMLIPIPIGLLLKNIGYPSFSIVYAMILAQILQLFLSIMISDRYKDFCLKEFISYLIKSVLISIIIYGEGLLLQITISGVNKVISFFIVVIVTVISFSLCYYFLIFNRDEKKRLIDIISKITLRIRAIK